MNAWLLLSLITLGVWAILYALKPELRKEMLIMSLITAPMGLTQFIFVPRYWSPDSLFNLAATTGFDIESIIWCFALGGIASVLYEGFIGSRHAKGMRKPAAYLSIVVVLISFLSLQFFMNPIFAAIIALFLGAIIAAISRPDLTKHMFYGGLMFVILYAFLYWVLLIPYPDVFAQWNLVSIGMIFGIPIEEHLYALSFGALWSGLYEYFCGLKLR